MNDLFSLGAPPQISIRYTKVNVFHSDTNANPVLEYKSKASNEERSENNFIFKLKNFGKGGPRLMDEYSI